MYVKQEENLFALNLDCVEERTTSSWEKLKNSIKKVEENLVSCFSYSPWSDKATEREFIGGFDWNLRDWFRFFTKTEKR